MKNSKILTKLDSRLRYTKGNRMFCDAIKTIRKNAFVCLVLAISICFFNSNVLAEETGIRIVAPEQGQQFAPGDTVNIEVEIPPSLHATDGEVHASALGVLKAEEFNGTHFKAKLDIPDYFAGPIVLYPSVYAGGLLKGAQLTINIRPQIAPKELIFSNRNYFLSPAEKEIQIYVTGKYDNSIERDITSSVTGTAYLSSDPEIISVDLEGRCRIVGKGLAVIKIENSGLHDFVMFDVEDPKHPNPPIDITNKVSIKRDSQQEKQNGHRVIQPVTITNTTDLPIVGPLWLLITDVTDGARANTDKVRISLPDGLNLFPGQSAKADLTFLLWRNVTIDYNVKLYHGTHIENLLNE